MRSLTAYPLTETQTAPNPTGPNPKVASWALPATTTHPKTTPAPSSTTSKKVVSPTALQWPLWSNHRWNSLFKTKTTLKFSLVRMIRSTRRTSFVLKRTCTGAIWSMSCRLITSQASNGASLTSTTLWMRTLFGRASEYEKKRNWQYSLDERGYSFQLNQLSYLIKPIV